ncbi:MAG: AEC family transporter [Bacilli bacterium]
MKWLIGLKVVAPLFIFMFIGYLLKKTRLVTPSFIEGLNRFSYKFTIPIVVFYSICYADFSNLNLDLLWFTLLASTVLFGILALVIHLSIGDNKKKGAVIQGFVRINQVLFAIPLLTNMYGPRPPGCRLF